MTIARTTIALLWAGVCVDASALPASADEEWVAVTVDVQCVLDNAQVYRDSGQNILMIVLSACPEPDVTKALATLTKNSAVPGIAVGADAPKEKIDDVIVYTPAELDCLLAAPLDLSGPVTRLPKKPLC